MTTQKIIISIALIALITLSTRALPFIVFGRNETPAPIILYLGKYLPPAIICAIIVYCFKDIKVFSGSHGLPELLSVLTVVLLQLKFKNTMLSIFSGTVLYMALVQFVFI